MSGLTSAIPTAIAGLLVDLQAVAALNPAIGVDQEPLVIIDSEIGLNVPRNYVVVEGVENWKQGSASLGNRRRDEEFEIVCALSVFDGGDAKDVANGVRMLAFAILEQLVQQITTDYGLGGVVRFAELVGGKLDQGVSSIGGWSVQVEFRIMCHVQLER